MGAAARDDAETNRVAARASAATLGKAPARRYDTGRLVRAIKNEVGRKRHPENPVDLVGRALRGRHAPHRVDALYVTDFLEFALAVRPRLQKQPRHGIAAAGRIVADDGAKQAAAVHVLERIAGAMAGHHLPAAITPLRLRQPACPANITPVRSAAD